MTILSDSSLEIIKLAGAVYGLELGNPLLNACVTQSNAMGLNAWANGVVGRDFGQLTANQMATQIVTNLGLNATDGGSGQAAQAWVAGQLSGVGTASWGSTILNILDTFATTTYTDPVLEAATTAYQSKIANAQNYGLNTSNTSNVSFSSVSSSAPPSIFNLTTAIDNITPAGNSQINGVIGTTGLGDAATTFNPLDSIQATGKGNTLSISDQDSATVTFPTVTVSGVQTANILAVGAVSVDTSAWTGLTTLNVTASTGGDTINAAGTTAVNVTNILAVANSTTAAATKIDGGSTVTVTATGKTTAADNVVGSLTIGGTTPATGNVTLTVTEQDSVNGHFGNINVTGDAGVTISDSVSASSGHTSSQTINSTAGTGVNSVTYAMSITQSKAANETYDNAAINATGGSSITVTQSDSATSGALKAEIASTFTAHQGAVTALDGGTGTTAVTITQMGATSAVAGTAATSAVPPTVTAGAPGKNSVSSGGTAAAALVPATLGIENGRDIVSGKSASTAQTAASSSITSVTLNNYGSGSYINSTALTSVTLSGTGAGVTIYNNGVTQFTSLALNLNGLTDASGVTINKGANANAGVTTLNVTTGGTGTSKLVLADTALTTLNVAGTQTLHLTGTIPATITTIAISGAAGFNDNNLAGTNAGIPSGATITTTSSGGIAVALGATQGFTGASGEDMITLSANHTKNAIKAGTGAVNQLILNGTAGSFSSGASNTWGLVSGFNALGIGAAGSGTYNLAAMGSNTFNAIEVYGALTKAATFTNVASGASLSVDSSITGHAGALNYQVADASGSSDSVTVNLGTTKGGNITLGMTGTKGDTGGSVGASSLTLQDANNVGIGTVSIVSNDTAAGAAAGNVNTIVALADSGLSTLNVSGVDGLTIDTLNEGTTAGKTATAASSFTIDNTSGGTTTIGTFTDSALGSLTFAGSGNDAINTLAGLTGHVLTVTNSGTGSASIGTSTTSGLSSTSLTKLTLSGSVSLGSNDLNAAHGANLSSQAGVTVSAASDNAHINIDLSKGAGSGSTDTITLGNANNQVTDASTAGTVNVTVGTGSNLISLGGDFAGTPAANTASTFSVTLGSHTSSSGIDVVQVGSAGASVTAANYVITGAVKGDQIVFAHDGDAMTTAGTMTAVSTSSATSVSTAITAIEAGLAANAAAYGVYGGNTYVVESTSATLSGSVTSVVEIVGTHTLSGTAGVAATSHGLVTLLS